MLNKGKEKPLATPTSCVRIRGVNDPGEKPLYIQRHILPSKADDVKRRKTAQKFRGCLFFAEFRRVSPSFAEFHRVSSSFVVLQRFGGLDRPSSRKQFFLPSYQKI
jgi:hypothetical protein